MLIRERADGKFVCSVWKTVRRGETQIAGFVGSPAHVVDCVGGLQESHGLPATVWETVKCWFDGRGV